MRDKSDGNNWDCPSKPGSDAATTMSVVHLEIFSEMSADRLLYRVVRGLHGLSSEALAT